MTRMRYVLASFSAAVVGALIAGFAPLATSCSADVCVSRSIFDEEGAYILVVVAVPVMVALIPLLVRHRSAAIFSAALLWVCCMIGLASIGMFFIPSAVLMTIAAARRDPAVVPQG